jgi:hypothetical protein
MRNLILLGVWAGILFGCGTSPAPQQGGNPSGAAAAPAASVNQVTITDKAANFAGKEVPFPATRAQLVAALGEPSRTLDKVNKIFVWDQQGIYAYSKLDRDLIHDISFSFVREEWDYAPQTTFAGSIQIDGLQVTKSTSQADLTAAGFQKDDSYFEKSLGTNNVLIGHEGGVTSLSFTVP